MTTRWRWHRRLSLPGEYDSAVSCYQNAMALAPTDIAARMQLAELYQKMQDDEAGISPLYGSSHFRHES